MNRFAVTAIAAVTLLCPFFTFNQATGAKTAESVDRLTIIGTADLQGRLDQSAREVSLTGSRDKIPVMGGIARIATMIREIKERSDHPVMVLSSGDDLMGAYFRNFQGKAIFKTMEAAGYQILALGNHEFDSGPGVLAEALDSVALPALCTDLIIRNTVMEKSCQPYLLENYSGIRVGFFSLMCEDFPVVTLTGDVKLKDSPAKIARAAIKHLRDKEADLIIAITHIGVKMDRKLATEVAGIDIIFGAHSHGYLEEVESVNNTLIVNGGEKGAALVRLDIYLDKEKKIIPLSTQYSLLPVTKEIEPDPNVEKLLAGYREQLPPTTVVGSTEQEWDLTKKSLRSSESSVANMVTDIIQAQFKVDIVLYNGGAFRGNTTYPPGPVTDTMLGEIDEFENNVILLTLEGKYIRQILERSATQMGSGGFLQGSGLRYTLNMSKEAQQLIEQEQGEYSITRPGQRIEDVQIQEKDGSWQPLDPQRQYRVASNDFLVNSGDHYYWFGKFGQDIRNTYFTMQAVMSDAFRKNHILNPVGPDKRILFVQ